MNQNQRREYLRSRDLEMSKQMEKTIKDAQPKPKPDMKLKLLKPVLINSDLITGTPQYKAEKQLSDLLLAQQIENTVKLAMYAVEGKKQEPMTSSVSQEMIDEYKKEIMKPVEIGGKKFLYSPVDMPKLPDPFDPKPLSDTLINEEDYQMMRTGTLTFIETRKGDVEILEREKQELEEFYKSGGKIAYDEEARRTELTPLVNDVLKAMITVDLKSTLPSKPNKANLITRIITIEKATNLKSSLDPIQGEIKAKKVEITDAQREIQDAIDAYNIETGKYDAQQVEIEKNRLDEIQYNNEKRQLAEELLNDFNRLNQGKMKISRDQSETDDDFFIRLQSLGAIPVDQKDIEKEVQTAIFLKAKKNISELTSDLSKVETVVKMLDNAERFELNKIFPRIKKQYSESFGINNKDLDANEIAQFIKNELVTGQKLTTPSKESQSKDIKSKLRAFKKDQLISIINELNGDDPTLGLLTGFDSFKKEEMIAELESKGVFDRKKFKAMLKIPEDPKYPITPTKDPKISGPAGAEEFKEDEEEDVDEVGKEVVEKEVVEGEVVDGVGGGIKSHALPSTVPFGKIALDLNKLYYQNVLSIKRLNGNKIIGHRNKRVSDNFVDLIMKMFENKSITQSDLRNIKDEQMLYDNLIVQSGLHKSKKIPTNIEQTSEQMKNRLGLITGEIEAGNSNKSLLTELHELLFKMVRVHLISKSSATAYYKNIKDQFFTL